MNFVSGMTEENSFTTLVEIAALNSVGIRHCWDWCWASWRALAWLMVCSYVNEQLSISLRRIWDDWIPCIKASRVHSSSLFSALDDSLTLSGVNFKIFAEYLFWRFYFWVLSLNMSYVFCRDHYKYQTNFISQTSISSFRSFKIYTFFSWSFTIKNFLFHFICY